MAGLKEIKKRLASVKNTKKITYAMKLVSAAKLRKVHEEVLSFKEYRNSLTKILSMIDFSDENLQASSELLNTRTVETIRVVVVGGFRGLAGGYNSNVGKLISTTEQQLSAEYPDASVTYTVIGKKAVEYLNRHNAQIETSYEKLPERIKEWPIDELAHELVSGYSSGKFDKVLLLYTDFHTALSQEPKALPLLPMQITSFGEGDQEQDSSNVEVLFEPSPEHVVDALLPELLKSELISAALNAMASEHGSRMTAMESATKNAGDLISELRLTYNKIRQSGITAELLDIIGGAEAVN